MSLWNTVDTIVYNIKPILWGCAAASMIGLAGVGFVGYLFWSAVLD